MRTSSGPAVITGGTGFLGSHLCERLIAENYEVLCLDNFLTGTPTTSPTSSSTTASGWSRPAHHRIESPGGRPGTQEEGPDAAPM